MDRLLVVLMIFLGASAMAFVGWAQAAPERRLAAVEAPVGGIQDGDWVFQDLQCGPRCALIREVTQSRYVHVGLVVQPEGPRGRDDTRVVWEAFHPVGPTPLVEWVDRGGDHAVAVYRPPRSWRRHRPSVLAALQSMRGRPYDGDYQWDDARIYCSELIAKAYAAAGVELVHPHSVQLGSRRATIAAQTRGRLTEHTEMVTPADLTRVSGVRRIVDPFVADLRP